MESFSEEEIYENLTFDDAVKSLIAFLNNPIAKRRNRGTINKCLADYLEIADGGNDNEKSQRLRSLVLEVSTSIIERVENDVCLWSVSNDLIWCCLKILRKFADKLPNPNYSRHIEQLKEIVEQ